MRTIKYSNQFKRDYQRERSGKSRKYHQKLDNDLMAVVRLLAADAILPPRISDHPLSGKWNDCRDCHVRPDLILSTGRRTPIISNWCGSAPTAKSVFESSPRQATHEQQGDPAVERN